MTDAAQKERFRQLVIELIDENPFAIRAVLKILETEFTDKVPTLAVTCEGRPRLLVNIDFVTAHCKTDAQIKAVISHEFLHVLLRHTEEKKPFTAARHLALDAIINAIIHRQLGCPYSSMMSEYYSKADGLQKLLRPMNKEEEDFFYDNWDQWSEPKYAWITAWFALYGGQLVADDIEALALQMANAREGELGTIGPFSISGAIPDELGDLLIGDHGGLGTELPDELAEALSDAMKEMNGDGIWRSPKDRGIGANPYQAEIVGKKDDMRKWKSRTLALLKRYASPDPKSRATKEHPSSFMLPVLSPQDRRATLRATWNPFFPEAQWSNTIRKNQGSAQIYLDVSGSMSAEMPLIIGLLGQLSQYIRRPFWAFSDEVAPAVIKNGILKAETTGGTSMACVLEHVAKTRPESAIVVTDGYIERLDKRLIENITSTRLHVLITRDGNPGIIHRSRIPYSQLDKVPA